MSDFGTINVSGNINLPSTAPDGSAGVITVNGASFLHDAGTNNIFLGESAGNYTVSGTDNIGIGSNADQSLTSGYDNITLGNNALQNTTIGYYNVAIGTNSVMAAQEATNCIGIGYATLKNSTVGPNVAIGTGSLYQNTTGVNNIGIGYVALESNTEGSTNVAIGSYALQNNTGSVNIGIGSSTLVSNTGTDNIAIGNLAQTSTTSGQDNIGIGSNALSGITIGNRNIGIGTNAGAELQGAQDCIGIGYLSSQFTTAGPNIAIGTSSLRSNTTGTNNLALGYNSLNYATTGSGNTGIGHQVFLAGNGNNNVGIGYEAGLNYNGTESNNILINNQGVNGENNTIRIGTSQSACYISGIHGVRTITTAIPVLIDSSGQLGTASSSRRYKENITPLEKVTEKISKLQPVNFKYIDGQDIEYGLIAEEVEKIFPDLVIFKEGKPESIKYQNLPPILLAGLQDQIKEIQDLKSQNQILTQRLETLQGELNKLVSK